MSCHEKMVYQSANAPAAIGPYSVAAGAAVFVFTAGQTPIDPHTGELVPGGITEQTRQVFTNLETVLTSSGSCLKNAVKTTVYLRDMQDFAAMNQVYAEFFPIEPPARTTVAVAGLPKNALVEIEVIAVHCDGKEC
jgi:2-iminobutanoate/2-iminopropanoate deaminase